MYERVNELLGTKYKNNFEINWEFISRYQILSESFIREFKNYVSWSRISRYQTLSESFIREFKNRVDWEGISQYQILSEDFIREFQHKVDWYFISKYQQFLSWNFILEFKDRVNWKGISMYQPFIEDLSYEKIDKESLKYNKLHSLYQRTKERGWFWGYRNKTSDYNFFELELDSGNFSKLTKKDCTKSRIYWNNFLKVMKNRSNNYDLIRRIKYV